jgi:hypothetical protein
MPPSHLALVLAEPWPTPFAYASYQGVRETWVTRFPQSCTTEQMLQWTVVLKY